MSYPAGDGTFSGFIYHGPPSSSRTITVVHTQYQFNQTAYFMRSLPSLQGEVTVDFMLSEQQYTQMHPMYNAGFSIGFSFGSHHVVLYASLNMLTLGHSSGEWYVMLVMVMMS